MLGKKKLGKKNHHRQFIIVSLGFERASTGKKGFICSKVSTSFECFVSAVAVVKSGK
jgi:hypothetical protein